MRKYETLVIARPELEKDKLKELISRLKERLERQNGQLVEIVDWGVRKLAYPIRRRGDKFFYGAYFLLIYVGTAKTIQELESYLKLIDEAIRFQTVQISGTAEKIELAEPVWREQIVPEVRLREDGEGLEVVEPSRERKLSREELYKSRPVEKPAGPVEVKEPTPSESGSAGEATVQAKSDSEVEAQGKGLADSQGTKEDENGK